jgi:hypothetical protein
MLGSKIEEKTLGPSRKFHGQAVIHVARRDGSLEDCLLQPNSIIS